MVNVTKDTLSDSAITFVRDILRKNLIDKQSPARTGSSWIFKGRPEDRELDPPIVILDLASEELIAINQYKQFAPVIAFDIVVWARKIAHRDEIADEVIKILRNKDSADSAGKKMHQNYLIFKRASKSNEDGIINGFPKVMRIKRVYTSFKYRGS